MPFTAIIADDDADIRTLVTIAARRAGIEVVAAVADGTAALSAIEDVTPDLAILDISMPGLTGIEICRAVRENPAIGDVRILLLSASVDDAARDSAFAAGADHFMAKPFSPRDLTAWLAIGKQDR